MSNHVAPGASVAAAEILLKLDPHAQSFTSLMHMIRSASDGVVTAALSELLGQGLVKRFGGRFQLTNKGFDLVTACRRQRPRRASRH